MKMLNAKIYLNGDAVSVVTEKGAILPSGFRVKQDEDGTKVLGSWDTKNQKYVELGLPKTRYSLASSSQLVGMAKRFLKKILLLLSKNFCLDKKRGFRPFLFMRLVNHTRLSNQRSRRSTARGPCTECYLLRNQVPLRFPSQFFGTSSDLPLTQ